jgi:hypothetical protein
VTADPGSATVNNTADSTAIAAAAAELLKKPRDYFIPHRIPIAFC